MGLPTYKMSVNISLGLRAHELIFTLLESVICTYLSSVLDGILCVESSSLENGKMKMMMP